MNKTIKLRRIQKTKQKQNTNTRETEMKQEKKPKQSKSRATRQNDDDIVIIENIKKMKHQQDRQRPKQNINTIKRSMK